MLSHLHYCLLLQSIEVILTLKSFSHHYYNFSCQLSVSGESEALYPLFSVYNNAVKCNALCKGWCSVSFPTVVFFYHPE